MNNSNENNFNQLFEPNSDLTCDINSCNFLRS